MRVWDLHPGYLTRSSLLGQHGEIHALFNVIAGGKKGYANHPETLRWQGHLTKLKGIHDLTVREMTLRGFRHHTPLDTTAGDGRDKLGFVDPLPRQFELLHQKYLAADTSGRIPLPLQTREYWAQNKFSVLARGNSWYQEALTLVDAREDCPVSEAGELLTQVFSATLRPTTAPGLALTAEKIWTELAAQSTEAEREQYMSWPPQEVASLFAYLYSLAQKYQIHSLLQSTIFADI